MECKEFLLQGLIQNSYISINVKTDSNKVFILLWADQTINKNTNLIEIAEM